MRIFTACLGTETHTWAPLPTDSKAFEDTYLVRGGDHPEAVNMFGVPLQIWRGHAEDEGWQIFESLCAFATPSGLVVKRAYENYRDEILADLKAGNPYRRTDAETVAFLDALDARFAQEEFALQNIQAREVLEWARVA